MQYKLKKLRNDASFREFFRLHKGKKTSIIVTAKKEKFKNIITYSIINKFLRKYGIYSPKVISQNNKEGILEIEDFGNKTLLNYVKNSKNILPLYKKCINVILKLQKIKPINKINFDSKNKINLDIYNLNNLHKESNLFLDWYLPEVLSKKKIKKVKKKIRKELNSLYLKIYFKSKFLVHRDFHVSNIMPVKKKLGIIDSQDIILGNPMYDVASLIDDVRFKVPLKTKNKILNYYISKCKIDKKYKLMLLNDFDILSIQRNLKILGIFCRLNRRDGKQQYLKYLPYTWKLIEFRMKNKIFKNLSSILSKIINKNIRKKTYLNENK